MRFSNLMIVALVAGALAVGLIGSPRAGVSQEKSLLQSTGAITGQINALAAMDVELANILADIDAAKSGETLDALQLLRSRANTLVYRITQTLADDYPCRPTKLQTASVETARPKATEYVEFDVAPELISMDPPVYPEAALREGIEGTVLVRVLVSPKGNVEDSMVIQNIPGLDAAAVASARTAIFKPALQKDRPVAIWMVIPIEFSLRG